MDRKKLWNLARRLMRSQGRWYLKYLENVEYYKREFEKLFPGHVLAMAKRKRIIDRVKPMGKVRAIESVKPME